MQTDDIYSTPAAYGAGAPPESYPSYTKLRSGEWGLKVPGGATEGQRLIVRTKAGAERWEYVGRVLWTGADRSTGATIALCLIGGRPAPRPTPQPQPQPQRRQRLNHVMCETPCGPTCMRPAPAPQPQPAPRSRRAVMAQRQAMPVITAEDKAIEKAISEAHVDAERKAVEAKLGADEPLF